MPGLITVPQVQLASDASISGFVKSSNLVFAGLRVGSPEAAARAASPAVEFPPAALGETPAQAHSSHAHAAPPVHSQMKGFLQGDGRGVSHRARNPPPPPT